MDAGAPDPKAAVTGASAAVSGRRAVPAAVGRRGRGVGRGGAAARAAAAATTAVALVATAACDAAPSDVRTVRTDSAGVQIVTSIAPRWGAGEGWRIEGPPIVEIGAVSGAPEHQFGEVVAAVRLGNGNIVVADRGASELRAFDPAGSLRWRVGRSGEGPGEFESLDFLGTAPGDSLVTYDERLLRMQIFDPGGGLARTIRAVLPRDGAAPGGSAPDKAVGIAANHLIIRYVELAEGADQGIVRWLDERLVAFDLADGSASVLTVVPGEEVERLPDMSTTLLTFANMPEYGAAGDRVAVIDTRAYSARVLSPAAGTVGSAATAGLNGLAELVVRRDVAPRDATDAAFELHLEGILGMVEGVPPQEMDRIEQMWRDRRRAPVLPVLRSVHVDAVGNLWLAPYYVAGAEPPPFEIHGPDGAWLGSVAAPPGLERAFMQYQAPYLEIGDDYMLGVWTDDLDVQYVRMYRIEK